MEGMIALNVSAAFMVPIDSRAAAIESLGAVCRNAGAADSTNTTARIDENLRMKELLSWGSAGIIRACRRAVRSAGYRACPARHCATGSRRGNSATKVERVPSCRSSGERRIMAPTRTQTTTRAALPAAAPGGNHVGQALQRSAGVEAARLHRRVQVPGHVRPLD